MADQTFRQLIRQVRTLLNGAHRPNVEVATASVNTTDATITLNRPMQGTIGSGSTLEVDEEEMYVTRIAPGSGQVTVIRGWNDTIPAAHAEGATVLVNTRFGISDIDAALRNELTLTWPKIGVPYVVEVPLSVGIGRYQIETSDTWPITLGTIPVFGYGVANAVMLDFRVTGQQWADGRHLPVDADLIAGPPTATPNPAGLQEPTLFLQLTKGSAYDACGYLTVLVPFSVFVDPSPVSPLDMLTKDWGLDPTSARAVVYGAALSMLDSQVAARTNVAGQGDSRVAPEVNTEDIARLIDRWRARREMEISAAALSLRSMYPYRRGT